MEAIYTAEATAIGEGRNGEVHSSDGVIDEQLAVPKEMGGPGGLHTNPEQLFAAGYAACFHNALMRVASNNGAKLGQTEINTKVHIGKKDTGEGFTLAVDLVAKMPGEDKSRAEELLAAAHQLCPYSNATRGNIEVNVSADTS